MRTIELKGVWFSDGWQRIEGDCRLVERDDGSVRIIDPESGFVFEAEDKLYLAADGYLRGFADGVTFFELAPGEARFLPDAVPRCGENVTVLHGFFSYDNGVRKSLERLSVAIVDGAVREIYHDGEVGDVLTLDRDNDRVFGFPAADYYQLSPGEADRFPNPALPRIDNLPRF